MISTVLRFFSINLILSLLLFAFSLSGFAQIQQKYIILTIPDSVSSAGFNPFGGYLFYGKKPRQFNEFYSLNLEKTKSGSPNSNLEIVGAVMTYNDDKNSAAYRMKEVSLSAESLVFKTEEINKTYYEFKGKYLQKGDLVRFYRIHKPVLKGVFTKYSDDKIVASSDVVFYFKVWKAESYYQPDK